MTTQVIDQVIDQASAQSAINPVEPTKSTESPVEPAVRTSLSETAQSIMNLFNDPASIVGQWCPKFATTTEIRKPGQPRTMDLTFACRLSICEFSLEVSPKGNIMGVFRIPPVHSIDNDGRFMGVLRARLRNAGYLVQCLPVNAKNGWGQINFKLTDWLDAAWLSQICRERSFPRIAGYQELQSRVRETSRNLLEMAQQGIYSVEEVQHDAPVVESASEGTPSDVK